MNRPGFYQNTSWSPGDLLDRGPLVHVVITHGQTDVAFRQLGETHHPVLREEGVMLIDTGADESAIDSNIASQHRMNLFSHGQRLVHGTGTLQSHLYEIDLGIRLPSNRFAPSPQELASAPLYVEFDLMVTELPIQQQFGSHHMLDGQPCELLGLLGRDMLFHFGFGYVGPTGHYRIDRA